MWESFVSSLKELPSALYAKHWLQTWVYMSSYMLKKNGQNRLVFATKSQNNDFIFLSGEVDSMKKKNLKPIYDHTYIHKKKST